MRSPTMTDAWTPDIVVGVDFGMTCTGASPSLKMFKNTVFNWTQASPTRMDLTGRPQNQSSTGRA